MRRVTVFAYVLAVAGCGGGGTSAFHPSAPGGTPVNQLSAQQAKTLCTEGLTYEANAFSPAAQVEYSCRLAGYQAVSLVANDNTTDAEAQSFCKVGYDACKANPPPVDTTQPDIAAECATAMADVASCTATVDQYTACVNERTGAVAQLIVPCSQLTKAKLLEILIKSNENGPACEVLANSCAQMLNYTDMMSSALKSMKR